MNPSGPNSKIPELRAALAAYGYGKTNPRPATEVIPDRVRPLEEFWHQPSRSEIVVDELRAAMSRETLDQLGQQTPLDLKHAYAGKMWRDWSEGGYGQIARWKLCWYWTPQVPGKLRFETRDIVVID